MSDFQGSQPIRENYFTFFQSGKRIWKKMPQIWKKSGNLDWLVHACPQKQLIRVFFHGQAWYVHNTIRVLKTAKIHVGCQIPIMVIVEFWDFIGEKSGNSVFLKCWEPWLFYVSRYFYVLRCSGISQKSAALIQPEKGMNFFCFLLFWESFNCHINFGTTGPIQVGFSAKRTWGVQSNLKTENVTCLTSDWFP